MRAYAYSQSGQSALTLAAIKDVRKLEHPLAHRPNIFLMAMKAHIQVALPLRPLALPSCPRVATVMCMM